MSRLTTAFTAAALATATPALADATYRGYETPHYAVVQSDGSIEVRNYEPALMAQVQVRASQSAALREGFRILAGYIFGGNVSADKIAMTAPVTQAASETIEMTSPVTQTGTDGIWTVSFMMPHAYTRDTLPIPKNNAIQFVETAPAQRIAIRFSGWVTPQRRESHEGRLRDWAVANGYELMGPAELAYYDDPMTLPWKRRNEVSFSVRQDQPGLQGSDR